MYLGNWLANSLCLFCILQHINDLLDGMLIRVLGRLFRHRLIPAIPTLTMKIFKEVAEHSNLSLLACFGSDEAAFRDVIIQRLEFPAEDINLKIAVTDFLTIISQTQIGIIECFFSDGVLENSIIDLMQEVCVLQSLPDMPNLLCARQNNNPFVIYRTKILQHLLYAFSVRYFVKISHFPKHGKTFGVTSWPQSEPLKGTLILKQ